MNSVLGYLPGHTHSLDWRQQNPATIFVMPQYSAAMFATACLVRAWPCSADRGGSSTEKSIVWRVVEASWRVKPKIGTQSGFA